MCAPALVALNERTALVEGALGAAVMARLDAAARAAGGAVQIRSGVSAWAPPTFLVEHAPVEPLAADLGWQVRGNVRPVCDVAPGCWPTEPRSAQGRIVAGIFSFEHGLFLNAERVARSADGTIRLERLIRERSDDRDIFRLSGRGEDFLTSSRTIAVIEAHRRRGTPLLDWTAGRLHRRSRSGHLPIPIARALRRRTLCASGPVIRPDGSWTYAYAADLEITRQLRRTFGAVIALDDEAPGGFTIERVIRQRRLGRRPTWYEPPHARHLA